jgi:hypothetical protein
MLVHFIFALGGFVVSSSRLRFLISQLADVDDIPEEAYKTRSYESVMALCAYAKHNNPVPSSPYGIDHYRHYGGIKKLKLMMNHL